jgi:hypothetical protein
MNTYRIYGQYIQKVYVDVVAIDEEWAQDAACTTPTSEWTLTDTPSEDVDINEVEFLGFGATENG